MEDNSSSMAAIEVTVSPETSKVMYRMATPHRMPAIKLRRIFSFLLSSHDFI